MIDMAAMERKRKRAAYAEDHALRRASTAVANAEAHLETVPRALVVVFVLGVVVGAIATALGMAR